MITKDFTVNIDFEKESRYEKVKFIRGDIQSNKLKLNLLKSGASVDLTNIEVKISFIRPDNSGVFVDAIITDVLNGKAEYIISNSVLDITGRVGVSVALYGDNNERLTNSVMFYFDVVEDPSDMIGANIQEDDRYPSITQMLIDEEIRQTNETNRIANEEGRVTNESTRQNNETVRIGNEATREANELIRQQQESDRVTTITDITEFVNTTVRQFVGTIMAWSIDWSPKGWLLCQGQELLVSEYPQLYSLIGNTYGGVVDVTFKLPDLRGRIPLGMNANYSLGGQGGNETIALNESNLPTHTHDAELANTSVSGTTNVSVNLPPNAKNVNSDTINPSESVCFGVVHRLSAGISTSQLAYSSETADVVVGGKTATGTGTIQGTVSADVSLSTTGQNEPVNIMPPYLVLNYIICYEGVYPVKSTV